MLQRALLLLIAASCRVFSTALPSNVQLVPGVASTAMGLNASLFYPTPSYSNLTTRLVQPVAFCGVNSFGVNIGVESTDNSVQMMNVEQQVFSFELEALPVLSTSIPTSALFATASANSDTSALVMFAFINESAVNVTSVYCVGLQDPKCKVDSTFSPVTSIPLQAISSLSFELRSSSNNVYAWALLATNNSGTTLVLPGSCVSGVNYAAGTFTEFPSFVNVIPMIADAGVSFVTVSLDDLSFLVTSNVPRYLIDPFIDVSTVFRVSEMLESVNCANSEFLDAIALGSNVTVAFACPESRNAINLFSWDRLTPIPSPEAAVASSYILGRVSSHSPESTVFSATLGLGGRSLVVFASMSAALGRTDQVSHVFFLQLPSGSFVQVLSIPGKPHFVDDGKLYRGLAGSMSMINVWVAESVATKGVFDVGYAYVCGNASQPGSFVSGLQTLDLSSANVTGHTAIAAIDGQCQIAFGLLPSINDEEGAYVDHIFFATNAAMRSTESVSFFATMRSLSTIIALYFVVCFFIV